MACAKTELCIFDSAMPQIVVENACFQEIFPMNAINTNSSPDIEFNITASQTDYLDLNDTLLYVKLKVTDKEGKDLAKDVVVTPAQYTFYTLFKDAILTLNSDRIEGGNGTYMYKALIENMITYACDVKDTNMNSVGYEADEEDRKKWIAESKLFEMCGPLQFDFFDQPKYLIPGVNVNIRLQRTKPGFSLNTGDKNLDLKIQLQEAKLMVRRVKVDPSVLMGHQVGLNSKNAIYPIRKSQVVRYTISKGSSVFFKDQIFGDLRLPKFVLVTFQSTSQNIGTFSEDCSYFKHFNVTNLTLSRNTDYRESYTQDFSKNLYTMSYVQSIIRNMGLLEKNLSCGISQKDFKDYCPFFTFVLAPDFDIHTKQLPKQGNLQLDIKFGEALPESAVAIIYGVFDDEIQINKNRTIIF